MGFCGDGLYESAYKIRIWQFLPYLSCNYKIWAAPRYAHASFGVIFLMAFCSDGPENVSAKFEVHNFTHALDNRGYPKNLGSPWIRPRSPFFKIFNGLLFGWTLRMYLPNLKSVALPASEIIAIEVLGGVANPQSWGRGGRTGLVIAPFETALLGSYRPP